MRIRERVSPRLEISEIADRAVKAGGPRAPLRERRGLGVAGRDQPLRHRAGGCSRLSSSSSWEDWDERLEFFLDPKPPDGTPRQAQGDPQCHGARGRLPEDRAERSVPGGRRDRRRRGSLGAARADVLAAGRRAVHHDAPGHHEGPRLGQDQRRHVPDAGLRPQRPPACTGRSTRTARARRAATSARAAAWRSPPRSAAIRRRSSPAIAPLPPGLSELLFAGFLRGEARAPRAGEDRRPARPGRGRDRARRLRRSRRAAPRGPVRRPHRLLLARRRLPGLPRDRHHPAGEARLPDDDRRAARRWRTASWARPSSGSSCRS